MSFPGMVMFFPRGGHVKVVRYLVDEAHCDPHVKNSENFVNIVVLVKTTINSPRPYIIIGANLCT